MERVVVAAILMLATTAALADTASPVAPDVERRIATAARVRVAVPHGTFELVRPRAESGGLAFRSVKGYPRPRPALIVGDLPPMPEPPSSPLSWASISRIERPVRRYEGAGTVLGGTLGFAAGAVLGWTAAWVVGYETNSGAVRPDHPGGVLARRDGPGGEDDGRARGVGAGLPAAVSRMDRRRGSGPDYFPSILKISRRPSSTRSW